MGIEHKDRGLPERVQPRTSTAWSFPLHFRFASEFSRGRRRGQDRSPAIYPTLRQYITCHTEPATRYDA